jgi:hypothetical protein
MVVDGFLTIRDCRAAYIETRDRFDLGASAFGFGQVFDQSGTLIARIAYNGTVWRPGHHPEADTLVWREH